MADQKLYPTPTRLKLLRAVADPNENVYRVRVWSMSRRANDEAVRSYWGHTRISARAAELETAGWIKLGPPGASIYHRRDWELTAEGRRVPAEAGDS